MGTRNIGGDPNDLSYRYKMPRLKTKIEGRGNGIKTRIVNMTDVAQALHRKPEYVTKWFGCELGAQSKCVVKDHLSIVNGVHDVKTLDPLLDAFIEKYVLCPKCKLPETDLSVKKGMIITTCNACGHRGTCDMSHRIAVFIIKNPPTKPKKLTKKNAKAKEDEQMYEDAKNLSTVNNNNDNDVVWYTDTSKEAAEKRKEQAANVDAIIYKDAYMSEFYKIVRGPGKAADKKKKIRRLQRRENIGNERRAELLSELCYGNDLLGELKKHFALIRDCCTDPRAQYAFICSTENYFKNEEIFNNINGILQQFYINEIVDEDVLQAWRDNGDESELHQRTIEKATDFFNWLESIEE